MRFPLFLILHRGIPFCWTLTDEYSNWLNLVNDACSACGTVSISVVAFYLIRSRMCAAAWVRSHYTQKCQGDCPEARMIDIMPHPLYEFLGGHAAVPDAAVSDQI
ncbi:hypothetical protein DFH29DRAFT_568083 [Suillus ampliporus]|nr:hypothetical protein DFH29DRAFT_568083 [Suillus ampliporus]